MSTQAIHHSALQEVEAIWFDKTLLVIALLLLAIGLIMVSSASISYADTAQYDYQRFHFVIRHGIYILLALVAALLTLNITTDQWQKLGPYLLISGIALLILVLFIGREVNGSRRWLDLVLFTVQVSEPVKIFVVSYLAGYLVRQRDDLQTQIIGFWRPIAVLILVTACLLLEPDFGASVVIVVTTLGMMFLAGAQLWKFIVLSGAFSGLVAIGALTTTYRLDRLKSFLDPWQDPYNTGYQLVNSLIAFGRGELWGLGLGNSIQKLDYLPEAHTDFVFAVLAEEMGFAGVVTVIALYGFLITKIMNIGKKAIDVGNYFAGYMAWGLGITLALQAVINMGVNAGLLPTKGLTLPLISYGGSSLIISCMAIAIVLRVDYETRVKLYKVNCKIPGAER